MEEKLLVWRILDELNQGWRTNQTFMESPFALPLVSCGILGNLFNLEVI